MTILTLEKAERVLILGGGLLALDVAKWILGRGRTARLITAPRHAEERIGPGGETLTALAAASSVDLTVVSEIGSPEAAAAVGSMTNSVAISIGAAWIFSPALIDTLFKAKLFNLHGSRLPQQRGGGGFSWQIMMGSRLGFCMLHRVDGGIDTGDIVSHREFLYPGTCRVPADFIAHYHEKNLEFLEEFLDPLFMDRRQLTAMVQPEYLSTYWPRLNTDEQAWIDWTWPVSALERFICAFDAPYAGAQTEWTTRTIRLKRAQADFSDSVTHPFQHGLVYRNNGQWICVAANGGTLIAETVVGSDGGSLMGSLRVGDRLFTSPAHLEARNRRVVYTPQGLKQPSGPNAP